VDSPSPTRTATLSSTPSATPAAPVAALLPGLADSFIYPSPARGDTAAIAYLLERPAQAQVRVYNRSGDLAAELEESKGAGVQESRLDLSRFSPGVYYYLLTIRDAAGRTVHGPVKFVILR
jgi:hypothetical protein